MDPDRVGSAEARDHLVLPLDVGDLAAAEAMMDRVGPWFAVAKVGLELYTEAGPAALVRFRDLGYRVFADLKLHDIPNTVGRAARVLGRTGVDMVTVHAAGGIEMMRAAMAGLRDGAAESGVPVPFALAVTVLTSDPDAGALPARLRAAVDAGCDGVVCAASDVRACAAAGMRTMVPGIRPAGAARDDQARVATPAEAIADGATWLVVGRPVTAAADPGAAAAAIHREVQTALSARAGATT
jgi:orotidine-5'-phosphate decarboxylase